MWIASGVLGVCILVIVGGLVYWKFFFTPDQPHYGMYPPPGFAPPPPPQPAAPEEYDYSYGSDAGNRMHDHINLA